MSDSNVLQNKVSVAMEPVNAGTNAAVVVVVVMTSPSGNCLYGGWGRMSRRDEEFYQTLNPEGSVSPS